MTDDAVMQFILLVEVHFPRPKFSGDEKREALWMRSMREILREYEPAVLGAAADAIVRTRCPSKDGTMFPKPSECIASCEKVRRCAEALEFLKTTDDRRITHVRRNLPVLEIRAGELAWSDWLDHFRRIGRPDIAGEAEAKGVIRASDRWPRPNVVVFEPTLSAERDLLASLPAPKTMSN